jgi:hypothetical protein
MDDNWLTLLCVKLSFYLPPTQSSISLNDYILIYMLMHSDRWSVAVVVVHESDSKRERERNKEGITKTCSMLVLSFVRRTPLFCDRRMIVSVTVCENKRKSMQWKKSRVTLEQQHISSSEESIFLQFLPSLLSFFLLLL